MHPNGWESETKQHGTIDGVLTGSTLHRLFSTATEMRRNTSYNFSPFTPLQGNSLFGIYCTPKQNPQANSKTPTFPPSGIPISNLIPASPPLPRLQTKPLKTPRQSVCIFNLLRNIDVHLRMHTMSYTISVHLFMDGKSILLRLQISFNLLL
jgi:hypothetical protein